MESHVRNLHLRGATGKVRKEMLNGKEHLVIPVVALMEGVIHPVNADTPEFVPSATLSYAPHTWNGRPVVVGHPTENGTQISANQPKILESRSIGTLFNSRFSGKKLLMDAYVDPDKAEKVGGKQFRKDCEDGKPIEVSVGAFVAAAEEEGVYNGKNYKAKWEHLTSDHLAFLPGAKGACSIEMGCGTHRAAAEAVPFHEVTEEEFKLLGGAGSGNFGHSGRPGEVGGSSGSELAHESSQTGKRVKIILPETHAKRVVREFASEMKKQGWKNDFNHPYKQHFSKDSKRARAEISINRNGGHTVYMQVHKGSLSKLKGAEGMSLLERLRSLVSNVEAAPETELDTEDLRTLLNDTESDTDMRRALLDALQEYEPNVWDLYAVYDDRIVYRATDGGKSCLYQRFYSGSDGNYEVDGKREKVVQRTVYDVVGDDGDGNDAEFTAAEAGGESAKENNMQKSELIKALTACPCSGFTEADVKFLESLPEERLNAFKAAADTRSAELKAAKDATEKLTAEVTELKTAASKELTEEQFMAAAPASLKALVESAKAAEATEKAQLVEKLKANGALNEAQLNEKSLDELRTLAKFAKVELPAVDYSGRAVPAEPRAASEKDNFAPPNAWAPKESK